MLAVLFYLNIFSSLIFPLISLCGRAAATTTITTTTDWAELPETKGGNECAPPPQFSTVPWFSLAGMVHIFPREPRAVSTAVFLEPKAEGSCFPYGKLMFSGHQTLLHPSRERQPFHSCLQLPPPASDPVKTSGADAWSESPWATMRELKVPFREQSFGLGCGISCDSFLTNCDVAWNKKVFLQSVIQSQSPKVEGKLPFFFQFATQGFASLNPC